MDSRTSECIDQLKLMPEKHGENILNIRSKAEQCITEDYQVKVWFNQMNIYYSVVLSWQRLLMSYGLLFQCDCLQVDKNTGSTPKKRDIRVSSLASIEDMRTPLDENMPGLAPGDTGTKAQRFHQEALTPLRTPFAYVN